MHNTVFLDETEICERSLRRLASSRDCSLVRTGREYQILGAGILGLSFTDDECWDVLCTMPQVRTLSGKTPF